VRLLFPKTPPAICYELLNTFILCASYSPEKGKFFLAREKDSYIY